MKYLVTGGAGFIGSHLVQALLTNDNQVSIIDNFATGKQENIAEFADRIICYEGSICDQKLLSTALKGVDTVFHQAAIPSVARSTADPWSSHDVNVSGTLSLLIAARDMGVKRVVYAGSSSAYGNNAISPKVETMATRPLSPYAISKLAAEQYCRVFADIYKLETVVLRYFNVFGPKQDANSSYAAVIPNFISALLAEQQPVIHGDGEQTRDFTYIANVITANLLAATADNVSGMVFNIACGKQISVKQLFDIIAKHLDSNIQARHVDPRVGDVRDSLADIGLARRYLRYEPQIDIEEGLQRTIAWFCDGFALQNQNASRQKSNMVQRLS